MAYGEPILLHEHSKPTSAEAGQPYQRLIGIRFSERENRQNVCLHRHGLPFDISLQT
jgi:hypothetical protein